jgi:hypothetical protein
LLYTFDALQVAVSSSTFYKLFRLYSIINLDSVRRDVDRVTVIPFDNFERGTNVDIGIAVASFQPDGLLIVKISKAG